MNLKSAGEKKRQEENNMRIVLPSVIMGVCSFALTAGLVIKHFRQGKKSKLLHNKKNNKKNNKKIYKGEKNMKSVLFGVLIGLGVLIMAVIAVTAIIFQHRKKKNKRGKIITSTPVVNNKSKTEVENNEPKADAVNESLLNELARAKNEYDKLESYRVYSKFFERVTLPLQYLFGIEATADDRDKEKIMSDLDIKVVNDFKSSLFPSKVTCNENGFHIASSYAQSDDIKNEAKNSNWNEYDIRQATKRYKTEAESNRRRLPMKNILEKIGVQLYDIFQMTDKNSLDIGRLKNDVEKIKKVMESNGVYALFASDDTVKDNPDLQNSFFMREDEFTLKYPGFFIEENGKLKSLGDNYKGRY